MEPSVEHHVVAPSAALAVFAQEALGRKSGLRGDLARRYVVGIRQDLDARQPELLEAEDAGKVDGASASPRPRGDGYVE